MTEEVLRLYKSGVRVTSIHKLLGMKYSQVKKILYGLETERNPRNRSVSYQEIEAVIKLSGKYKYDDIAIQLGISKHRVKYLKGLSKRGA